MSRNRWLLVVMLILFGLECFSFTYYKSGYNGFIGISFLYLISGILIAVLPAFLTPVQEIKPHEVRRQKVINVLIEVFFLALLLLLIISEIPGILTQWKIDYHYSDVIPQIQECCKRLVKGEKVYAPIPEIWNGMNPTYLPMMWLPYVPFQLWTNDLRWTNAFMIAIMAVMIVLRIPVRKRGITFFILLLLMLVFYLFLFMIAEDPTFISASEESVAAAYYLLLGFALMSKNPWMTGLAIRCCLLSRYVLLFWIPVYIIFLYLHESRRSAMIVFTIVSLMVLLVFVIPFGLSQPQYFFGLPHFYHQLTYQRIGSSTELYSHNLGMSKFFGKSSVAWLILLEVLSAAVIPVLCFLIFQLKFKWRGHLKIFFGLSSLKLTLTAFYSFIEMPYPNLFLVPVFFSVPIILFVMHNLNDREPRVQTF